MHFYYMKHAHIQWHQRERYYEMNYMKNDVMKCVMYKINE